MSYQLIDNSTLIRRLSDGASIPPDPTNRDYQEFQRWLDEGNTPQPPDVPDQSTQPDFQKFLDLILVSNLYQSIVAQAVGGNPAVSTGLTVTMGALLLAAGGAPNLDGLQAGINLLFSGLSYNNAHVEELSRILDQSNLTNLVTIPQP